MPTNFNSISVILNNIRSIRNSHGEARSSISCQDDVYAWMKQQSSWCNLSQNENVNKARLTYCTTALLLYCASINGDRSLKYLTNLICFYTFKAIFWCFVFSMAGSWDPLDPPGYLPAVLWISGPIRCHLHMMRTVDNEHWDPHYSARVLIFINWNVDTAKCWK